MVRPTVTLRFPIVGAVLFLVGTGTACAQINLPHPINKPALVLEYDRAIYSIKRGMALHWSDPQLFLQAFDRMSRIGTAGEQLDAEYKVVRELLGVQFWSAPKPRPVWDELPPAPMRQPLLLESVLLNLSLAREALIVDNSAQP
jgi:hypothetical protein